MTKLWGKELTAAERKMFFDMMDAPNPKAEKLWRKIWEDAQAQKEKDMGYIVSVFRGEEVIEAIHCANQEEVALLVRGLNKMIKEEENGFQQGDMPCINKAAAILTEDEFESLEKKQLMGVGQLGKD